MRIKLLKTEDDYNEATARVEQLMEQETHTGDEMESLELLAVLVERYEQDHFPIEMPSPNDAICFRMEQKGLKQVDLVPYFGSKSKVSEVLSGKRPLSLQMIRKLHSQLGIPAEVLLQKPGAELPSDAGIEWLRFPISEMKKRGWFDGFEGTLHEAKQYAEELITRFAGPIRSELLKPVYYRQNSSKINDVDGYALAAWRVQLLNRARVEDLSEYQSETVTSDFVRDVVRLSYFKDGPLLAKEFLNNNGIHLFVEPHFIKTYLDGAALFGPDGRPIIGLTLRYDRLDNFWFTLCHELAHLALHLTDSSTDDAFFDDMDAAFESESEKEADLWATNLLLDKGEWESAELSDSSLPKEIINWAKQKRISPAIPAGRIRKDAGNYKLFSRIVGQGKVRKLFVDSGW